MTWQPTVDAKLGVVVHAYEGIKADPFLPLNFGETVQILEACEGWYRGFALKRRNKMGIFPASHIQLKECSVINKGSAEKVIPKEIPIIIEMTHVLQSWGDIWKKVYVEGSIQQCQDLIKLIQDILDWRRQILSQPIPREELKKLKLEIAHTIDYGNKLIGLDVIPRKEETGEVIDPCTASIVNLYNVIRKKSSLGIVKSPGSMKRSNNTSTFFSSFEEPTQFHLFMKFKALVLAVGEEVDLLFSVYDAGQNEVISEKYVVALQQMGLPKDQEKINQTFVTFTDFDTQDLYNRELYLFCEVIKISSFLEGKKLATPARIPLGIAVHPLHEILNGRFNEMEEKQIQMEIAHSTTYYGADFAKLPEYVIGAQKKKYTVADKGTGVFVAMKMLYGSLQEIRKGACVCHKMRISEAKILPGDRHDIYLQLISGYFHKGTKKADKNVEITFTIVDDEGKPIPNCLSAGEGEGKMTSFKSLVFYHTADCRFNEYIKISIPKEMMPHVHANFVFAHHSAGKAQRNEFGCAHLRLMNKDFTALKDESHELVLYNYKETAQNMRYLQMPCEVEEKGEAELDQHLQNISDNFLVKTIVCSTLVTQDVNLLKLFNWEKHREDLPGILSRVKCINGNEICKFLQDTCNALFAILESHDGDDHGQLVFEALSYSIALLSERKYSHFRSELNVYCTDVFKSATVYDKLMDNLLYVLEQVMITDGTRQLHGTYIRKTFIAAEYLIKFIIQSRIIYDRTLRDKNKSAFLTKLKGVITTARNMIKQEFLEGDLLGPKYQAKWLEFFHSTFPDFLRMMSKKTLSEILADFLSNITGDNLKHDKAAFMLSLINSELFKDRESRIILLPAIIHQLDHLFFTQDDMANKILGDVLLQLHKEEKEYVKTEVQMLLDKLIVLMCNVFIDIEKKHDWEAVMGRPSIALVQNSICILGLIQLMDGEHYAQLKQTFQLARQLEEFVVNILYIFQVLTEHNMYPQDWGVFLFVQSQVILNSCELVSQVLMQDLSDSEHNLKFRYSKLQKKMRKLLNEGEVKVPMISHQGLIAVGHTEKIDCDAKYGGSYQWKGHDFKIMLPPGCADETVTVTLGAYLPSSSQEHGLLSAVFDVTTSIETFKEPVTVHIPHCANIKCEEDKERLHFLILDKDSHEVKKGDFEIGKSFGSIELTKFGELTVVDNKLFKVSSLRSVFPQLKPVKVENLMHTNRRANVGKINKKYLDVLILPSETSSKWYGIYLVIQDISTYWQCLYDKKWIHPTDQVLTREVTFVDNTDDATAEICLADEDKDDCIITLEGDKKISKQKVDCLGIGSPKIDTHSKNNDSAVENFPRCILLGCKKISSPCQLKVKGLHVSGQESSDFDLASPTTVFNNKFQVHADNEQDSHVEKIKPLKPEKLTAHEDTVTETTITLSWQGSDPTILDYEVEYRKPGEDFQKVKTTSTRYTVAELKPYSKYEFRVAARNSAGFGPFTDVVTHFTSRVNCSSAAKQLRIQLEKLTELNYESMELQLFSKEVITSDQKTIIDKQIGRKKMEYLLIEIIMRSLNANFSEKYKLFLKVMEENKDIDLQRTAKMLR